MKNMKVKKPRKKPSQKDIADEVFGITINKVLHGNSGYRFTVDTKINICEFILTHEYPSYEMAKQIGVSTQTVAAWMADYREGKLKISNVTQINRKEIRTTIAILTDYRKLEAEIKILESKRELLVKEGKEALKEERDEAIKIFGNPVKDVK